MHKIFLWVIFFLGFNFLWGQSFNSPNLTTEEGLISNEVQVVYKDSNGFLWVGTANGLSKIDNGDITNYNTSHGLTNNSIKDIIEDASGTLWFGTSGGGVTKYDGENFSSINLLPELETSSIRKFYILKNWLLIGSEKGLFLYDLKTSTLKAIEAHHDRFQVMGYFIYNDEVYCAVYRRGIFKLDLSNNSLKKIRDISLDISGIISAVFSIYQNNNQIYYGISGTNLKRTGGAIMVFDAKALVENKQPDYIFGKSIVWDYAKDQNGNIYCAAWGVNTPDGGLYQIKDRTFIDLSSTYGINSKMVSSLHYDANFNFLYVGTLDKGIYTIDLNNSLKYNSLGESAVLDIGHINNHLIILSSEELMSNDLKGNLVFEVTKQSFYNYFQSYLKKHGTPEKINQPENISLDNFIFHKVKVKNGFIWVSSNLGVFKLDTNGKIAQYLPINTNEFEIDDNFKFLSFPPYAHAILYHDILNNRVHFFNDYLKNKETFFLLSESDQLPVNITQTVSTKNNVFAISPRYGLYEFNWKGFESLASTNVFSEKELKKIAIDDSGSLLAISTISGQIYVVNISSDFKILKQIPEEQIIGKSTRFIQFYNDILLVGTNEGINLIQGDKLQFIGKEHGLISEIISGYVYNDSLVIGCQGGYYMLNVKNIINSYQHPLEINKTSISINHVTKPLGELDFSGVDDETLLLKYNENSIGVAFSISPQPYPKELYYSFQVKGLDSVWSAYNNSRAIDIPYLPHGKYDINIRVKDLNTGSISTHKLISLNVGLPIWKTGVFIWSMAIILFGILFLLYKKRIRQIKFQAEIKRRLSETKLEALNAQMNPHFTFNALNSIQKYILTHQVDVAIDYLGEFSKLIRMTLDNSSKHTVSLVDEINYLKVYSRLENMRFDNKVEVKFINKDVDFLSVEIPPMIIQPFIENAFIHAYKIDHKSPKLIIDFYKKNNVLICDIIDNGKGFDLETENKLYESKGMRLVAERLSLINNGFFHLNKNEFGGTTVSIHFQL